VLAWLDISEEGLQKILSSKGVEDEWTGEDDLIFGNMRIGETDNDNDSDGK